MDRLKLYYGIVSLISLGLSTFSLICLGGIVLDKILITDEEYLANHTWIFDFCKREKSEKKCLEERRRQIILQREYSIKQGFIRHILTILIVLPLFCYHFKRFKE